MEEQTKRLLLAIGLSFAFIFLWQTFFVPAPPPPVAPEAESAPSTSVPAAIVAAPAPARVQTIVPILGEAERTVTVTTPLYTAVVTNRGAGIRSFTLTGFIQDPKEPGSPVQMVRLLPEGVAPPLALEFTTAGGPMGLSAALFASDDGDLTLSGGGRGDLVFTLRTPEGFEAVRTLSFSADDYAVKVSTRLINAGATGLSGRASLDWTAGLEAPRGGTKDKSFASSKYAYSGAVYLLDGKTKKFKTKNLKEPAVLEPAPEWISSQDVYFIAALLPGGGMTGGQARIGPDGRVQVGLAAQVTLPPGGGVDLSSTAYIGPKESKALATVDPTLEKAIDLGMFSIIARPLLALLKFFFKYIPNYGVAIILLTIMIKVIFIPFTNISHRSMKKMSQLQPQINALRDRYKKDRDKLNQEIMELYKANKVNPAGGCLPMLAQIPVFFALYKALLGAIELRHAPFAFWITDLSAKDPFYITPIIMGATMVLQQKMTPTSMDPRQAQLMMFLPIVFTAMFLSFPSGLVLYWLMNNVLTIGHQYLLNRADGGVEAAAPAKGKGRKK